MRTIRKVQAKTVFNRSRAVQYPKGHSSHKLLAEFASLRKTVLGAALLGTRLLGRE